MKIYTPQEWAAMEACKVILTYPDFDAACEQFRNVCNHIKIYFELDEFKGGFDEMTAIYTSQKYQTNEGLGLVQAWAGLNELCKYEGSKAGYGQPGWWYKCWQLNE